MYALYNLYVPFKIMQAANSISMYPYTIRVQKMQAHCFSKISTCLTTDQFATLPRSMLA